VVCIDGVWVTEGQLEIVLRHFRLRARRFSEKDIIRGVQNRYYLIVLESAPAFPYVVEAGLGMHVNVPEPVRLT